jgi:hypothetical protein
MLLHIEICDIFSYYACRLIINIIVCKGNMYKSSIIIIAVANSQYTLILTNENIVSFNRFPKDPQTYAIDRQFMWGDGLMISPVLAKASLYLFEMNVKCT